MRIIKTPPQFFASDMLEASLLKKCGGIFWVIVLSTLLISCAGQARDQKKGEADGVLIIYGEGLIPAYDDPTLSVVHFLGAERISKALEDEFHKLGIRAIVYPHRDKSVMLTEYLPLLLARKKREALVLVKFVRQKDAEENSLYLEISFRPLTYQLEPSRVMFGEEFKKKYYVLSDGIDNSKTLVSTFARNYMIHLQKAGNLPTAH